MERLIVKFGTPKPIGFREYDENTVSALKLMGASVIEEVGISLEEIFGRRSLRLSKKLSSPAAIKLHLCVSLINIFFIIVYYVFMLTSLL